MTGVDQLTAGVDLASQDAGTAIAYVAWAAGARVVEVVTSAADADVVRAVTTAGVTGVDCPLGWPRAFSDLVAAHRSGADVGAPTSGVLANRVTDLRVAATLGVRPLSVSADRIAYVAFRWARIESRLRAAGVAVSRDGRGPVAEVYPAAALKAWGLPYRGYKGVTGAVPRADVVDGLRAAAPWLDLGPYEDLSRASDHVLDAVVCALIARSVALGRSGGPPPELADAAAEEGWICLPGPLTELP